MGKRDPEKIHGSGGFIDVSDVDHSGLARVRPPRPETLSEADSVAANAHLSEGDDRPLWQMPPRKFLSKTNAKRGRPKGSKDKYNVRLGALGISREALEKAEPSFRHCIELADRWRKHRQTEYIANHGYVSSGVGALLASAALALAASRFLHEKAAATGDLSLLTQATRMATDHRQTELSAWELCAREGIARRKVAASLGGTPWLVQGEDKEKASRTDEDRREERASHLLGGTKRRGRPRKEEKVAIDALDGLLEVGDAETTGASTAYAPSTGDSGESGPGSGSPPS